MSCLTDERLLDVHLGDATPDDRHHLAGCPGCAERLAALARDASRMSAVLRGVPPTRRRRATRAWMWAPAVAAAVLALAIGLSPNPASLHEVDPLVLAEELASLFEVETHLDDDATDATTTAASTCPWGDPLLEVGCDEPTVMQIAWR